MTNYGMGGVSSGEFFARFEMLNQAVRPAYAVLPGWAFNNRVTDVSADQAAMDIFFPRLLASLDLCALHGIRPIIMTRSRGMRSR